MYRDQALELRDELRVMAEGKVDIEAVHRRDQPELLQPPPLALDEVARSEP